MRSRHVSLHRLHLLVGALLLGALSATPAAAAQAIAPKDLAAEITARRERVPQFQSIAEMAHDRGLRVWLFGGTAAAYAHYVRWDLRREQGDPLQPDRFDYAFTHIFRTTQDLDLVVDGRPEEAQEFQIELQAKFPYFMGRKGQWEVRTLRQDMGEKEALLSNPDFLDQHTDSNSTGMIELTEPPRADAVVRDLRDWDARGASQFLRDVAEAKLHFYFSEKHETTRRFLAGKNPPIFSVIRYFTKAFQYGLETRPEDLRILRGIIRDFDPKSEQSWDVVRWLNHHAPKLFKHAMDLPFAWNRLEALGLRAKLLAVPENHVEEGDHSLAWWMDKEPLRDSTDPRRLRAGDNTGIGWRGGAPGRTAEALGITVVTHETSDFLAYEAIRRSHKGVPIFWISRQQGRDENAALGDGLYTQKGEKGGRSNGWHIRMTVNPDAREGQDFLVSGETVLWLTRDKLRVIHESLKLDPVFALNFLLDPRNTEERGMRAVFMDRLDRFEFDPRSSARVTRIIGQAVNGPRETHEALLDQVLPARSIQAHPKWLEWVRTLVDRANCDRARDRATALLGLPGATNVTGWREEVQALLAAQMGPARGVVTGVLTQKHVRALPYWKTWVDEAMASPLRYLAARSILSDPGVILEYARDWDRWLDAFFSDGQLATQSELFLLGEKRAARNPKWAQWIEHWVQNGGADEELVEGVLSRDHVRRHPKWSRWIGIVLKRSGFLIPPGFLAYREAIEHSDWGKWMNAARWDGTPGFPVESAMGALAGVRALARPDWQEIMESTVEHVAPVYLGTLVGKPALLRDPRRLAQVVDAAIRLRVKNTQDGEDVFQAICWPSEVQKLSQWSRWIELLRSRRVAGRMFETFVQAFPRTGGAINNAEAPAFLDLFLTRGSFAERAAMIAFVEYHSTAYGGNSRIKKWISSRIKQALSEPREAAPMLRELLGSAEAVQERDFLFPSWIDQAIRAGHADRVVREVVLSDAPYKHHLRAGVWAQALTIRDLAKRRAILSRRQDGAGDCESQLTSPPPAVD